MYLIYNLSDQFNSHSHLHSHFNLLKKKKYKNISKLN